MDFAQAAELKRYILKQFSVVLHIHDTCGGLYLSIDEPNEYVKEFIVTYCRKMSIPLTVSADGTTFFPADRTGENEGYIGSGIRIAFEADRHRAAAYDGDRVIGVCTFRESGRQWVIDHTFVDSAYRDRGIAGLLVEKVVLEAKAKKITIIPVCSYAAEWFEEHKEYQDIKHEL